MPPEVPEPVTLTGAASHLHCAGRFVHLRYRLTWREGDLFTEQHRGVGGFNQNTTFFVRGCLRGKLRRSPASMTLGNSSANVMVTVATAASSFGLPRYTPSFLNAPAPTQAWLLDHGSPHLHELRLDQAAPRACRSEAKLDGVGQFRYAVAGDVDHCSLRWWRRRHRPNSSHQFRHPDRHLHVNGNRHMLVMLCQPQSLHKPDITGEMSWDLWPKDAVRDVRNGTSPRDPLTRPATAEERRRRATLSPKGERGGPLRCGSACYKEAGRSFIYIWRCL